MEQVTIETVDAESISPDDLRPLLVTGTRRGEQEQRLNGPALILRNSRQIVAIAAFRCADTDLTVTELAIASGHLCDEIAEEIVDELETIGLAGNYMRVTIGSTSRSVRRALRLLAYAPQMTGRRTCFVRRLAGVPEIRQIAPGLARNVRPTRPQ